MFEIVITCTGRGFGPKERYAIFEERRKGGFASMREVYAFLRAEYGKAKRAPMYVDRKDGTTIKCGWVIGFRNADYSHAPVQHWLQQDWVHVNRVTTVAVN